MAANPNTYHASAQDYAAGARRTRYERVASGSSVWLEAHSINCSRSCPPAVTASRLTCSFTEVFMGQKLLIRSAPEGAFRR